MTDVFICDAIRTPVGRYGGGLAAVRADDLAAIPITALLQRNKRFGAGLPEDARERARQMRFLQQRGFTGDQIRAVFRL